MDDNNSTHNPEPDQGNFKPDVSMAQRFLTTLSLNEQDDIFAFQIFPESTSCTDGIYPEVLHGAFDQVVTQLIAKNNLGCGIFVTINRTDGKGRKRENIREVRAVFVDLDGTPPEPVLNAALEPHIVVKSSPGRFHAYWLVENITLEEFTVIQKALASLFGGDPQVVDLSRVMRLPGFYHLKKSPYQTEILHESSQQPYTKDAFLKAFGINSESPIDPPPYSSGNSLVLEALKRHNLLIGKDSSIPGAWFIKCPWGHLHTKQDKGTKYFEPSTEYPKCGFNCFHAHCAQRTLKDLVQFLMPTEPLPLHRQLDAPLPFPVDALGDIMGPAAKAIQRVIQAPDAVCAQSVLGAAALLCQPFVNVVVDGRETPLVLYLITIAESGDRKSSADKVALKPIYDWQKSLNDKYRVEHQTYLCDLHQWEAKKKNGQSAQKPPRAPLEPIMLVEEPTYEGIVKYLTVGQPSIGLFSDEGGRFFGGNAMNKENLLKTISGLSSLWDGKPITRMRSADGSALLYGRRVALHLMIQEVILEQLMSNPLVERQGFLPRCLITYPSTTAGTRQYIAENLANDSAVIRFWERQKVLLATKLPVKELPAPQNELYPGQLMLSHEAKNVWIAFHNEVELDLGPGKKYEPIKRFANKAAEHVLRLAGIMSLFDNLDVAEIEEGYILRAITLTKYYLEENLRIQGYLSINPDLSLAQKTLSWCWEKGKEVVSLTELYQKGPVEIRQAKKARLIMSILEEHGWAIPRHCSEVDGIRHKETWEIRQATG